MMILLKENEEFKRSVKKEIAYMSEKIDDLVRLLTKKDE
jgi:hypothetical protein